MRRKLYALAGAASLMVAGVAFAAPAFASGVPLCYGNRSSPTACVDANGVDGDRVTTTAPASQQTGIQDYTSGCGDRVTASCPSSADNLFTSYIGDDVVQLPELRFPGQCVASNPSFTSEAFTNTCAKSVGNSGTVYIESPGSGGEYLINVQASNAAHQLMWQFGLGRNTNMIYEPRADSPQLWFTFLG